MSALRTIVKGTAFTLVTSVALIFNEATGYNAFQWGDLNIACSIDPTCRKLSDDEITLAQEYYGDTINYDAVNVFERPYFFMDVEDFQAVSMFGNLYAYRDSFQNIANANTETKIGFVHEIGHVWQHQNLPLSESSKIVSDDWNDNTYYFEAHFHDRFLDFGIEQQPSILERIFALRAQLLGEEMPENHKPGDCEELVTLETLAGQELPISITDCSTYPLEAPEA